MAPFLTDNSMTRKCTAMTNSVLTLMLHPIQTIGRVSIMNGMKTGGAMLSIQYQPNTLQLTMLTLQYHLNYLITEEGQKQDQ